MKWYSRKEFQELFSHKPTQKKYNIYEYAKELSDGMRFWLTTIAGLMFLGSVAFLFKVKIVIIALPISLAFGSLIFMILGYLLGGMARGFFPKKILLLAIAHITN